MRFLPNISTLQMFFYLKIALMLPQQTNLNKYAIELKDGKQLFYGPLYSLGLVKLETLRTYMKTYLKIRFSWPCKFLASASILFEKKLDGSFQLFRDY